MKSANANAIEGLDDAIDNRIQHVVDGAVDRRVAEVVHKQYAKGHLVRKNDIPPGHENLILAEDFNRLFIEIREMCRSNDMKDYCSSMLFILRETASDLREDNPSESRAIPVFNQVITELESILSKTDWDDINSVFESFLKCIAVDNKIHSSQSFWKKG